VLLTADIMHL